jgi:hypothetical protein
MSIHTSSGCVDIIKEKFVCREEILDVFCGFSCCKFGFLEGNYDVVWMLKGWLGMGWWCNNSLKRWWFDVFKQGFMTT